MPRLSVTGTAEQRCGCVLAPVSGLCLCGVRVRPGARYGRLRAVRARRTAYDRVRTACKSLSPCVPATASHENAATPTGAPHSPPAPCRACTPDPHADGPHPERLERLWTGGASCGAVLAAQPKVRSTAQGACVCVLGGGGLGLAQGGHAPPLCVRGCPRRV